MSSWLRTWTLRISLAASVAIVPLAAAQHDDLWRDCVVADLGGSARQVRCTGMTVSLSHAPTTSQDGWLEAWATGAARGAPITREQLDVDGRRIALRILRGDRLRVFASPISQTLVVCEAEPSLFDRCRAAITWIVRRGLPPGVAFPEPQLELLGRPLRVPTGCELVGVERIRCASGEALGWRNAIPGGPRETIAGYERALRLRFPEAAAEEVPCIVAGRVGLGARFVIGPASTIVCAVEEGGGTATAQCIGYLRPGTPWPEPCAQVFQGTVPE
jgi:hypothetical protein